MEQSNNDITCTTTATNTTIKIVKDKTSTNNRQQSVCNKKNNHDNDKNETGINNIIIEEDWSQYNVQLSGFAQYNTHLNIPISPTSSIRIKCATDSQQLSPLDMMQLSNGTHDTTGSIIWMGSHYLIHALPILKNYLLMFFDCCSDKDDNNNNSKTNKNNNSTQSKHLSLLELGCGTGISGIAFCKYFETLIDTLILTDFNSEILQVANDNAISNLSSLAIQTSTQQITWGEKQGPQQQQRNATNSPDIILATDVLYDANALPLLLQTIQSLSLSSWSSLTLFILAHVPRANCPPGFNSMHDFVIHKVTSNNIIFENNNNNNNTKKQYNWTLAQVILPIDLIRHEEYKTKPTIQSELHDMQQAGAEIFVFLKKEMK